MTQQEIKEYRDLMYNWPQTRQNPMRIKRMNLLSTLYIDHLRENKPERVFYKGYIYESYQDLAHKLKILPSHVKRAIDNGFKLKGFKPGLMA